MLQILLTVHHALKQKCGRKTRQPCGQHSQLRTFFASFIHAAAQLPINRFTSSHQLHLLQPLHAVYTSILQPHGQRFPRPYMQHAAFAGQNFLSSSQRRIDHDADDDDCMLTADDLPYLDHSSPSLP
jgi:hypothetical protein